VQLNQVADFLEEKSASYNRPDFISLDPISIPHRFSLKQDIEIAGLFAAVLAWGQRKTILKKCSELLSAMDNAPYDFVMTHEDSDLHAFTSFKHRTFNATDTLYFIEWLRQYYFEYESLEKAFTATGSSKEPVEDALVGFHNRFFSLPEAPARTRKHVATPVRKSACKRLNMYLRWMVRKDNAGVDFGIWNQLAMKDLICPLDLHVDRVARKLGLIDRKQTDWQTAIELTSNLRLLDPADPVKYDFALFGLGVEEKF
jgi:uncharacterized protein (TIGR02757 family)